MRIHGDKIVTRRSVVEKRTPYGEYLDILREDFADIVEKANMLQKMHLR